MKLFLGLAAGAALLASAGCEAPIASAVRRGDAAGVAAQLDKGADINQRLGALRMTPLQIAASRGRLDVAKLLLDRGADVNVRRNGTSALSQAAVAGDLEMVRLLLSRGAEAGRREIGWARGPRRAEIVALLEDAARRTSAAIAAEQAGLGAAAAADVSSAAPAGVDAPAYAVGEHSDDVALVVGIARSMDGVEARFASEDAAAVRRHLLALGVPSRNVVLLSGEAAGRAALSRYLERWIPNNVVENSRVFFYFAGAGVADAAGRAYLLPWDGDASQPEATGYPLTRVYSMLNAAKVRAAVVVIDAGFSGAGPRTAAAPKAAAPAAKIDLGAGSLGDAVALIASKDAEPAGVEEGERHGTLTYFLLKGLNGGALDARGVVTLRGLYGYALARTADSARGARAQTPQLLTGGLGEADLRLR
jgi:hypothetical protein